VVTAEAVSDDGLFTVHRIGDNVLFEVPDSVLGRDMLLISRIAGVPANMGGFLSAGTRINDQLVRLERVGDRLLLRKHGTQAMADDTLPIARSVVSNNFAPILAAFDIEAIGPDSVTTVIDVTDFFEGDTPALSGLRPQQRRDYQVRRLDATRSYVQYARSYPLNVNVRHTLTYDAGQPPSDAQASTISMEMNQSMVLLPKEPMRPRYADDRVGFFSMSRVNYGLDEQKAATETFLRRWRLEPSDPAAYISGELVEPLEPITYYVDPATPERWRGAVKRGVENWQAAFETAGFRNAIIALDAPSAEEDPEWDPEDVRHSVVRWTASLTRNAVGPSTSDPRTGEIIESDIVWYHNHMRSYRNWMMVQTGAANPGARSLPISDELMEEAMEQVITHEIGHAPLGGFLAADGRITVGDGLRAPELHRPARRRPGAHGFPAPHRPVRPPFGQLGVPGHPRCGYAGRRAANAGPVDRRSGGRSHVPVPAPRRVGRQRPPCPDRGHGRRPGAGQRIRNGEPSTHRAQPHRVDDPPR
jgi:hypothetical protein